MGSFLESEKPHQARSKAMALYFAPALRAKSLYVAESAAIDYLLSAIATMLSLEEARSEVDMSKQWIVSDPNVILHRAIL